MKNFFKLFKKISRETLQSDSLKEFLKTKYLAFQSLLTENNNVLSIMADMEEKLSGEYLFDKQYIIANSKLIEHGVSKIIEHINIIADNKYKELHEILININKKIEDTLMQKTGVPVSDLTVPIEKLTKEMTGIAGGKIAHLGEIKSRLNLAAPEGFSISAYAFKRFLEHNNLNEKINKTLAEMSIDNMEKLNETSRRMQDMVTSAEIPEDLQNAINKAVEDLKSKVQASDTPPNPPPGKGGQGGGMFSVRSSAIFEDGEFSFAGQYATFLNIPGSAVIQKYKEVVASLFTPRAIFYYKTKGFSEEDMVMAVGVLEMIDAKAGGVIYTTDPNAPDSDTIIINAVRGLGKSVVDGTCEPASYIISKKSGSVIDKKAPEQQTMFICSPEGDTGEIGVPDELKNTPCLTEEQIKTLYAFAVSLENHYGKPQDIEWAAGQDDKVYALQSRPLKIFPPQKSREKIPLRVEGRNILLNKGIIACKGISSGNAFILKDEEELKDFPGGAVLVARHSSTKFVTIMNKASAIITDVGSVTGHMASLSREYGIPTILDTDNATSILKNGQEVTVDAINCNIYEGKVDELLKYAGGKKDSFKDTRLFLTLEKVLKLIVSLNLTDPDSEDFKPENCKTLHDITRFAHEMAMAEIFKTGKGQDIETFEDLMSAISYTDAGEGGRFGPQTCALKAGIPIDAHLLDIDGGVKNHFKKVTPADITSVPFSAFLKGLTAMRWPEPRPADAKGFLGMVAHTASMREDELQKLGGKSYAIVSSNYMNFSIRLGYHFSMVEAYAGENMNDNYIKFFFKGGGAAADRRLRRVRLIREILKNMDFKINVKEDVINAILTKYKQAAIEQKLEIMGKLTVYTKQLDMVMYNDAVTDMFIEDFVGDHIKNSE